MYRSSTGNLGQFDNGPSRNERWDRDRFERIRGRNVDEHRHFEEHDRFPGGRRDIDFDERYDRRGPHVADREYFHERDRFRDPGRRRNDMFEEGSRTDVNTRALAPYRRKSVVEKDIDIDIAVRRPARPQFVRRQSSLDTYDRRPLPRYGDLERTERIERVERDEWRPPANVPIPLPIRERRRSPDHRRFGGDEYEEVRYRSREREPRRADRDFEEYREVEVKREKSTRRRSRSRVARSIAATSVRSSSSSSFEELLPERAHFGKKGRTKMPKRLVKKQAVIELGYPFEEEEDFIIVRRALEKEHIDEIIKISENYKDEKTTYVYEEKKDIVEPPSPEHVHHHHHHHAPSVRTASPGRHALFEERIEESNHINGPLTVLVPDEHRVVRTERDLLRSERDIKDEIRALEAERRMLRYEREGDFEIIERREPRREVVRIEKDRKVRREPNPKLVAAMMATLT